MNVEQLNLRLNEISSTNLSNLVESLSLHNIQYVNIKFKIEQIPLIEKFLEQHRFHLKEFNFDVDDQTAELDTLNSFRQNMKNISTLEDMHILSKRLVFNLPLICFIDFKDGKNEDIKVSNVVLSRDGTEIIASQIAHLKNIKNISITLKYGFSSDAVENLKYLCLKVRVPDHLESFIILDYTNSYTNQVVADLNENKQLDEVLQKFKGTMLSGSKNSNLILNEKVFPMFDDDLNKRNAMWKLLCHNVRLIDIFILDVYLPSMTNAELELLAKAVEGSDIMEIMILCDSKTNIESGLIQLVDVLIKSKATEKQILVKFLGDNLDEYSRLVDHMPKGTVKKIESVGPFKNIEFSLPD